MNLSLMHIAHRRRIDGEEFYKGLQDPGAMSTPIRRNKSNDVPKKSSSSSLSSSFVRSTHRAPTSCYKFHFPAAAAAATATLADDDDSNNFLLFTSSTISCAPFFID